MKKIIIISLLALCVFLLISIISKGSGSSSNAAFETYSIIVTHRQKITKLSTLKLTEDMLLAATQDDGDTVAMILAHPYLTLGLDLKNLTQDDVFERNDTVFIHLPQPEITHCGCNPNDREVIFDDTDRHFNWDAEMKKMMTQAEERIKESAAKQHLFEKSANNAVKLMCKLLSFDHRKTIHVSIEPFNQNLPHQEDDESD